MNWVPAACKAFEHLIDRVPVELWMEVHDIVQETGIKTIPTGLRSLGVRVEPPPARPHREKAAWWVPRESPLGSHFYPKTTEHMPTGWAQRLPEPLAQGPHRQRGCLEWARVASTVPQAQQEGLGGWSGEVRPRAGPGSRVRPCPTRPRAREEA